MVKIKVIEEIDGQPTEVEVEESLLTIDAIKINKLIEYAETQGWI